MSQDGYKLSEYAYDFGDATPPADFNPDAKGYADATPGKHKMFLDAEGSKFVPQKEFKFKGETFVLTQLQARLVVAAGEPQEGASTMDFLAMPTPGAPMPPFYANQWANFIKAFGFRPPANALVPPGFKHQMLAGTPTGGPFAMVDIVHEQDQHGKLKTKKDGTPQYNPKLFGYSPVGEANGSAGTTAKTPAPQQTMFSSFAGKPASPPTAAAEGAASKKAADDFDL